MASSSAHHPSPKPPDIHSSRVDGGKTSNPPENHPTSDNRRTSYASIVAGASSPPMRQVLRPRFPPLSLPARQVSSKDGCPSISFTGAEIGACEKLFEHSIVAKFTVGRPNLPEIQKAFVSQWRIAGRASLSSIWDSRHVLIVFDSEDDVRVALSSSLNKVGHAYFRLFRWFPDYNPKQESTVKTVWVRLPNLPISLYEKSFIEAIVSTFGYFVNIDDRTKACTSLRFARACVEIDVMKSIPKAVWISLPDNRSYWQDVEVEGNMAYCKRCKVHGHSLETCRKARNYVQVGKGVEESRKLKGKETMGTSSSDIPNPKAVSRDVSRGANNNVVDNIGGSSKEGAQWQEVPRKEKTLKAARGTFTSSKDNGGQVRDPKVQQKDEVSEGVGTLNDNIGNKELAVVLYSQPLKDSLDEERGNKSDSEEKKEETLSAPSDFNIASAEVFTDEGTGLIFHPAMVNHYNQIQEKAGSTRDMTNVTTRPKPTLISGSKHCPKPDLNV